MKNSTRIVIPQSLKPRPSKIEIEVAFILLDYFLCNVYFIERNNNKTPDFLINGLFWELKSPRGGGSKTIENILRDASRQPENVILNLSACKLNTNRATIMAKNYMKHNASKIKRMLIIAKNKRILDLNKENC